MKNKNLKIYGAGLAGLLAGCMFQNAEIFEAAPRNKVNHKALLRFRSSAVGDAVGIDFRKVRVHKGIWMDNRDVQPSIQLSNLYSKKVIGNLADRSIWNIEPCDRYIAPEDFIEQLMQRCESRIAFDTPVTESEIAFDSRAISTLPMSVMLKLTNISNQSAPIFQAEPIKVKRWLIPGADVFQTIYFPSPDTNLYRASITKDLLIAEYMDEEDDYLFFNAFGLWSDDCVLVDDTKQQFGKISPIDNEWRKKFMFDLTTKHNIYSLGRFGTWRNILLDDVLKDISVIKKLMNSSIYERSKFCNK